MKDEGKSRKEIAKILGRSVKAVMGRLYNLKKV